MKPVATYCRWRNALSACWEIPFGVACLAIALILVPYFVAVEVVGREHGSWAMLLLGLMPLLFAWLLLRDGVRNARAALDKNGWLKAGPDGVFFRLPPDGERMLAWGEIVKWYEHVTRVNGIPTSHSLIFQTRTETVDLPGSYFSESVSRIIDNIVDARASKP